MAADARIDSDSRLTTVLDGLANLLAASKLQAAILAAHFMSVSPAYELAMEGQRKGRSSGHGYADELTRDQVHNCVLTCVVDKWRFRAVQRPR
jgi:hypothetical protein